MAKRGQLMTLEQIENILGYKVDYTDDAAEGAGPWFYSDLTQVSSSTYQRAIRELEEYNKQKNRKTASGQELPQIYTIKPVSPNGATLLLERISQIGLYNFNLQMKYDSISILPLRLTRTEASKFMTVAKFRNDGKLDADSIFFKIPREIRDKIYTFSISDNVWRTENTGIFAGALGDPTGFYFPLSEDLSVLRVSKRMRQEALPIAYRRTFFRLDDIDEFIKIAISIGDIGRANIESVEFAWESRSDTRYQDQFTESEDTILQPPTLHVQRCVQLLKECNRLRFLRLFFEPELISQQPLVNLKFDPGILGLSSFRGLHRLEVQSLSSGPLDQYDIVKWLVKEMQSRDMQDNQDDGPKESNDIHIYGESL